MSNSVFSQIIRREIPATIVFENDEFIAFKDIHPHAPVHVLVVPKVAYETLEDVPLEDDGFHARLLKTGRIVAAHIGIADNYRLVMNVGKSVQAVHHVHLHVLGGWSDLKKAQTQTF